MVTPLDFTVAMFASYIPSLKKHDGPTAWVTLADWILSLLERHQRSPSSVALRGFHDVFDDFSDYIARLSDSSHHRLAPDVAKALTEVACEVMERMREIRAGFPDVLFEEIRSLEKSLLKSYRDVEEEGGGGGGGEDDDELEPSLIDGTDRFGVVIRRVSLVKRTHSFDELNKLNDAIAAFFIFMGDETEAFMGGGEMDQLRRDTTSTRSIPEVAPSPRDDQYASVESHLAYFDRAARMTTERLPPWHPAHEFLVKEDAPPRSSAAVLQRAVLGLAQKHERLGNAPQAVLAARGAIAVSQQQGDEQTLKESFGVLERLRSRRGDARESVAVRPASLSRLEYVSQLAKLRNWKPILLPPHSISTNEEAERDASERCRAICRLATLLAIRGPLEVEFDASEKETNESLPVRAVRFLVRELLSSFTGVATFLYRDDVWDIIVESLRFICAPLLPRDEARRAQYHHHQQDPRETVEEENAFARSPHGDDDDDDDDDDDLASALRCFAEAGEADPTSRARVLVRAARAKFAIGATTDALELLEEAMPELFLNCSLRERGEALLLEARCREENDRQECVRLATLAGDAFRTLGDKRMMRACDRVRYEVSSSGDRRRDANERMIALKLLALESAQGASEREERLKSFSME